MKTELSAVRKILRSAKHRGAHHQVASRALARAVKFQNSNPEFAAQELAVARFNAQWVA